MAWLGPTRSTWAPDFRKCPRQRGALERGQQDVEGYRKKLSLLLSRVDYGQSSRRSPGPDPPSRSLRFGLLLSGPWAALSSALTSCPPSLGITNLPSLLLNPPQGFQVKVLRRQQGAFRLFETRITQVLHFSKSGTVSGQGWGPYWGLRSGFGALVPGRVKLQPV